MIIVLPRRCSSCKMAIISMRARGSRPLAGSSSSSTGGSWINTRARLSRLVKPRLRESTKASRCQFKDLLDDGLALPAGDAIGTGEELQVLGNFQVFVDADEVGHVADVAADK